MTLKIEMVSDVVCPWCWVGLRRFLKARAALPNLDIAVSFRPYELDPDLPSTGADYKSYMRKKFGPSTEDNRGSKMRDALVQIGAAEDIPFRLEAITRRPNTLDAHRLIKWASGHGLGLQAKEALFEAFFSAGKDIGSHETLVSVAGKIGLDVNIVSDLLATDADIAQVKDEAAMFRAMGVSGVPTFIANRSYAVQGAQDVEIIQKFLQQAQAKTSE